MSTSRIERESLTIQSEEIATLDSPSHSDQMNDLVLSPWLKFQNLMKFHVAFHLFFLIVLLIEIIFFAAFFAFLAQSSIIAFSLAVLFLTFFSYFVLKIYLVAQKPEQLNEIKEEFIRDVKNYIQYEETVPESHIALANFSCRFADFLHCKEYHFYALPSWLNFLASPIEKFSCWWHWEDVHQMKELLLQTCIEENIKLVKCEPTSLDVHASLANAFVMLSGLYVDPRKIEGYDDERWIPPDKYTISFEEKFRSTAEKAIEEFKVLNNYAPNDPWVHSQLAYSYHDLQMPMEEIREYETILQINPEDQDTLFRLGVLYFQQGMNAQGLRIYEKLKRSHHAKAETLIKYYGIQGN